MGEKVFLLSNPSGHLICYSQGRLKLPPIEHDIAHNEDVVTDCLFGIGLHFSLAHSQPLQDLRSQSDGALPLRLLHVLSARRIRIPNFFIVYRK